MIQLLIPNNKGPLQNFIIKHNTNPNYIIKCKVIELML